MARRTPSISRPLTRGLSRKLSYAETGGLSWGALSTGAGTIRPFILESETTAYVNALIAAGETVTDGRKYSINNGVIRLKALGVGCFGNANCYANLNTDTSSGAIVDFFNPSRSSTIIGSPTYVANAGWTTSSTANYVDSPVALSDVIPNDSSMGVQIVTNNTSASGAYDMGATAASVGLMIFGKPTALIATTAMNCAAAAVGATTDWLLPSVVWASRLASGSYITARNGRTVATTATASATTASALKISYLFAHGASSYSRQRLRATWVMRGVTDVQGDMVHAIMRTMTDGMFYGEPDIQPAGYGDATVSADVVVYGLSMAAICCAYQLKRLGRTVVMVGDYMDSSVNHLGGMPANGLGWIDAKDFATVNGIYRAIIKEVNVLTGGTDANTQAGLSVPPDYTNYVVRSMLASDKIIDATLPGYNIQIYFSNGVASTQKTGAHINSITTVDGRVISGSIFVGADYDGDIVSLAGMPYLLGMEAVGSAPGEDLAGFHPANIGRPSDSAGNSYNIDPYISAGVPASGLLPYLITMPTTTPNAADPFLQAMNYRLFVTNVTAALTPMTGGTNWTATPSYNASVYETLARFFQAKTDAGRNPGIADIVTTSRTLNAADDLADWNNTSAPSSLDLAQSGISWLSALSYASRLAIRDSVRAYMQDLFYWGSRSGDPRITATFTSGLANWGLADTAFLDPGTSGNPLRWPGIPYRREPIYQMVNSFGFSGNDTFAGDGTTPRSIKTVGCASYRADIHSPRHIAYDNGGGAGTIVWLQGGISDSASGGANLRAPIPLEAICADKAVCDNYLSPTHFACSKIAWASARMEPCMALIGQGCAIIADMAITGGIAVQDIDYPTFRTTFLAVPDASTPVLPQVN